MRSNRKNTISLAVAALSIVSALLSLPQQESNTPAGTNLWENGGFEGANRSVIFPEITIFNESWPYYCDPPYTADKCSIPLAWNPYEPTMHRPEFKPANPLQDQCVNNPYFNRVKAGCNAQQLFCFSCVMDAGVYQVIRNLQPGTYRLRAWAQIWSTDSENTQGCIKRDARNKCIDWLPGAYTSDIATEDDKTAMFARIGYDLTCGENAFSRNVVWKESSYAEGLYDQWGQVELNVPVTGNCVTLYVGGYNRFAKTHNNLYLDEVSFVLEQPATPTPEDTCSTCEPEIVVVTATPLPPVLNKCDVYYCQDTTYLTTYTTRFALKLRLCPSLGCAWAYNETTRRYKLISGDVSVRCVAQPTPGSPERWASQGRCDEQGKEWFAISIDANLDGIYETLSDQTFP